MVYNFGTLGSHVEELRIPQGWNPCLPPCEPSVPMSRNSLSLFSLSLFSLCVSTCLSICLSACLTVYPALAISIHLSIYLSGIYLSIDLSIYLSTHLSIYIYLYHISIYPFLSIYPIICLLLPLSLISI